MTSQTGAGSAPRPGSGIAVWAASAPAALRCCLRVRRSSVGAAVLALVPRPGLLWFWLRLGFRLLHRQRLRHGLRRQAIALDQFGRHALRHARHAAWKQLLAFAGQWLLRVEPFRRIELTQPASVSPDASSDAIRRFGDGASGVSALPVGSREREQHLDWPRARGRRLGIGRGSCRIPLLGPAARHLDFPQAAIASSSRAVWRKIVARCWTIGSISLRTSLYWPGIDRSSQRRERRQGRAGSRQHCRHRQSAGRARSTAGGSRSACSAAWRIRARVW